MRWTKVSNKYAELIFADASDSVFRTYIRLLLLVSSMEFAPNLEQISTKLGKRKVQTLIKFIEQKQRELGEDVISLNLIIQKVMEDVEVVLAQRNRDKVRKKRPDFHVEIPMQRREEKRREEYISTNRPPKASPLTDEQFISSLKTNHAFSGISIDDELGKMDAWLLTRPGRKKTRRFIINWLNRVEKSVSVRKERPKV